MAKFGNGHSAHTDEPTAWALGSRRIFQFNEHEPKLLFVYCRPSEEFYKAYANDQTLISSLPSDKPQSKAVRKQRVRTVDETSWKETLIGPAAQEAMDFAERHFSTVAFCLPINEISKDRKAGLTS